MQPNEQVLVDRFCGGDHTAFHELVGQYKKKIYYLAYDITGNHQEAEDISQEVFIKMFRSLKKFRRDSKMSSWLYQITVNASIDTLRKKSSKPKRSIDEFDHLYIQEGLTTGRAHNFDPVSSAESSQIQNHISQALQKITPKERTVFVMRHYNDLKLNEIAEILNVTIGTVKSLLFRAIKKLRKELSSYMGNPVLEVPNE
ncbi:MAG: RNA polymerase sigma factor [Candidatus Aminicenantes bacterium]|jgi:RNA polymerase sigma-70 factor (ECF subfamily)